MFFEKMDVLLHIRKPIEAEMNTYRAVFDSYMVHTNPLLREVLATIASRKGKMMRPMLTLLTAKMVGGAVNDNSILSAATFEFFHTASLIHDDVVDESAERRGQDSVNSAYSNQVAVLVGDFILANALRCAAKTGSSDLVNSVSDAAQCLSSGELLQLHNVKNLAIDEAVYFDIIRNKTAALFAACAEAGALSVSSDKSVRRIMAQFGENVGICFQIRDDIFDYSSNTAIGKPTGNDMKEGKLTLPVIHAVLDSGSEDMLALARKVKSRMVSQAEIDTLVEFTKANGGIEYAEMVMNSYAQKAKDLLDSFPDSDAKQALNAYVDYVIARSL